MDNKIDIGPGGIKLKALSDYLAEELTTSQIDKFLGFANLNNMGKSPDKTKYYDLSKANKIYNSIANDININKKCNGLFRFLEVVYDPSNFTKNPENYKKSLLDVNKYLIQMGMELNEFGKIIHTKQAKTLDEVEQRVNNLKYEITSRGLHKFVLNYCNREMLSKDYFHAVLEASKGVFERIRLMSNLNLDGRELIEKVFNTKKPILMIRDNYLTTSTERNIYLGNASLLCYIVSALRNTTAHVPRVNVKEELADCMEYLTAISLAHKFLDNCYNFIEEHTSK